LRLDSQQSQQITIKQTHSTTHKDPLNANLGAVVRPRLSGRTDISGLRSVIQKRQGSSLCLLHIAQAHVELKLTINKPLNDRSKQPFPESKKQSLHCRVLWVLLLNDSGQHDTSRCRCSPGKKITTFLYTKQMSTAGFYMYGRPEELSLNTARDYWQMASPDAVISPRPCPHRFPATHTQAGTASLYRSLSSVQNITMTDSQDDEDTGEKMIRGERREYFTVISSSLPGKGKLRWRTCLGVRPTDFLPPRPISSLRRPKLLLARWKLLLTPHLPPETAGFVKRPGETQIIMQFLLRPGEPVEWMQSNRNTYTGSVHPADDPII
ncbi:hypothetical protein Bbelb_410480, partial [Branchiostoma belcheri]